jgi:2-hydroxy-6-oxonona-2,4-dienedioate hydrolase
VRRTTVLALAGLGAAGAGAAFLHDMTQANRRLAERARAAKTRIGTVEYALVGEGAPTLVLHGASGGFDQSLDLLGELADRGRLLIAPSRFGYLGSPVPPGASVAMQADAYDALLDDLAIDQVDVIAVSAGAWSALAFAIRHPDRCRSLTLIAPASRLTPGAELHGGAYARAVLFFDVVAWVALKLSRLFPGVTAPLLGSDPRLLKAAAPAERRRLKVLVDHILPVSRRRRGVSLDIGAARNPEPLPLDLIACPILALAAEDDPFGAADRVRRIAAAAPSARAVVYPSGGHALAGRYDQALGEVMRFLQASTPP